VAKKNRKAQSVEDRYGKYTASTIKLSKEGIDYEVLLDKYISYMTKYMNTNDYQQIATHRERMNKFLDDLVAKFRKEDKERKAPGCGSGKQFERCFDGVIKAKVLKRSISAADEKKCIHVIEDLGCFFGTEFLNNPEESLCKKNAYIHSLVLSLIDIMVKSDLFYYLPHTTKALGYQCYWNQMKMIENNIEILFKDERVEIYELWQEILEPLRKIIGDGDDTDYYPGGDFPGITSKIWLDANPILAYFNCVYDIAENDYQLYERINDGQYGKVHFDFKIGEDEFEVRENIKRRNSFFRSRGIRDGFQDDFEKEKQVFFMEFRRAYINIVMQYMHIDIV